MGLGAAAHSLAPALRLSSNVSISSQDQAVVFGPSFIGFGKRPSATPAHHDDAEIGIIGSRGGDDFRSPMICLRRKYLEVFWVVFMRCSMLGIGHGAAVFRPLFSSQSLISFKAYQRVILGALPPFLPPSRSLLPIAASRLNSIS